MTKRSVFKKRSVTLAGHRTSIALEPAFWNEIEAAAKRRGIALAQLISEADQNRSADQNLTSVLRLLALAEAKRRD